MAKATLERDAFLAAASAAERAAERRAKTIPILTHAMIEIRAGEIRISGTNLDQMMTVPVAAETDGEAQLCAPIGNLCRWLAATPKGGQVKITYPAPDTADNVLFEVAAARFQAPTLPAADFPKLGASGDFHAAGKIGPLLAAAATFTSRDEYRYYLNGVFVGRGCVTATDGHQLYWVPLAGLAEGAPECIIPTAAVTLIESMGNDVAVETSQNMWRATGARGQIAVGKLIDGTFPDVTRVKAAPVESPIQFDADAALAALTSVVAVSSERSRGVAVAARDGRLTITCYAGTGGMGEAHVSVEGESAAIGFNGGYLRDVLKVFAGRVVEMHSTTPLNAAAFHAAGTDAELTLMPMRIVGAA